MNDEQVLKIISDRSLWHPPSYREIMEQCNNKSLKSIDRIIKRLSKKGLLKKVGYHWYPVAATIKLRQSKSYIDILKENGKYEEYKIRKLKRYY